MYVICTEYYLIAVKFNMSLKITSYGFIDLCPPVTRLLKDEHP